MDDFLKPLIEPLSADPAVRILDLLVLMLTLGAIVVAVAVVDGKWPLRLAAAALGAFGSLVLASAQPSEISLSLFAFLGAIWAAGAILFAEVMNGLLSSTNKPGFFEIFADIGDGARRALAPRRWPEAQGKEPPTSRDLAKRFFVAISAATGGVIGNLMSLELFWSSLAQSITVSHLFRALLFTVVSVTLSGPFHEYLLVKGMEPAALGHPQHKKDPSNFFRDVSPRTIMRFGLVFLLWIAIDITMGALAACVSNKNVEAMYQVVLGGLTPGFVSYYWCAALQLDVPSVRKTATWPSVASGAVMLCAFSASAAVAAMGLLGWVLEVDFQKDGSAGLVFGSILLFVVITLTTSLLFSWIVFGVYAFAGGHAIDRYRGSNHMVALGIALLLGTVPQQALSAAIEITLNRMAELPPEPTGFFGFLGLFNLVAGTVGWYFGLVASGFPALVKPSEASPLAPGMV